tara:strand:- start:942 stop:1073 length:132 start_codon:yes stop_codon:yes gene_type:complete
MNNFQKLIIERAAALARENTQKLQKPMPHTLLKRRRLEKKGKR